MTASADKVQFILQSSLEETLPLVKKGIFSQQQLRQVMIEREKHQNKLYSSTYKLSHYLKAIEFEYDLQRQRLYRIKNQQDENINPMFKKQGKTDFSVVRRIIKLWDRTMHKYRFRTYLWKQYLSFCIVIKSKKHFYKALTNALRFLPFELQLWKIGVRYEVEIGRNLWKARKLFHKGLKLVPSGEKSIQLTRQLIKFELEFVETLQSREKIIQGQDEQGQNDMKFIMGGDKNIEEKQQNSQSQEQQNNTTFLPNQQSQLLKLREYHQILFVALVDSITKNYKSKTYFRNRQDLSAQQRCEKLCDLYLRFLQELKDNEENELIEHILAVTLKKLRQYKEELGGVNLEEKYEEEEQGMEVQEQQDEQNEQGPIGNSVLIEQASNNQQLMVQQQQPIPSQKPNPSPLSQPQPQPQQTKQQQLANEIFQSFNQTKKFDQKKFSKAIKQLCLKPLQLSYLLQKLLPHFFNECLDVLRRNDWLRVPLKSLQTVLKRVNLIIGQQQHQGSENINISTLTPYMLKQFQKINPIEYMSHSNLLKQVITFNRNLNKIQQNNKLFRSLLVNCKQNIQFIERAKSMFVLA